MEVSRKVAMAVRSFRTTIALSTVSLLLVALSGCGRTDLNGRRTDEQSSESPDTAPTERTDASDPGDGADPNGADGVSDTGVATGCDVGGVCSSYWIDLKVRTAERAAPMRTFGGTIDPSGRDIDFTCPKPEGADRAYRCEYEALGDRGAGDPIDSSVRIPVGAGDRRDPIRDVRVRVIGDRGYFDGTVDLSPYTATVDSGEECSATCRGSRGTVPLEGTRDDPDFQSASAVSDCTGDGDGDLVFSAGADLQADCSVDSDPRVVARLLEEYPSPDRRFGTFDFGVDEPNGGGRICRQGACSPASGAVSVRFYAGGEVAEGYWYAETAEGDTFHHAFTTTSSCVQPVRCM